MGGQWDQRRTECALISVATSLVFLYNKKTILPIFMMKRETSSLESKTKLIIPVVTKTFQNKAYTNN